jgi:hypothetical protein
VTDFPRDTCVLLAGPCEAPELDRGSDLPEPDQGEIEDGVVGPAVLRGDEIERRREATDEAIRVYSLDALLEEALAFFRAVEVRVRAVAEVGEVASASFSVLAVALATGRSDRICFPSART